MEELLPELRTTIGPRLKGKAPERQRTWIQVCGWGDVVTCPSLPLPCAASALGTALPLGSLPPALHPLQPLKNPSSFSAVAF